MPERKTLHKSMKTGNLTRKHQVITDKQTTHVCTFKHTNHTLNAQQREKHQMPQLPAANSAASISVINAQV